ncbi:MAG: molybdopterin converting factor subunit 1 [Candidatus Thorarchaeota archaeon]|jgi:molybdopterin converting factor subunit 1
MKIKVKFFASYKEAVGRDEMDLEMKDESNVSQLLEAVKELHPTIGELIEPLIVSVNKEYAEFDKVLKDGDEVALLPPVSGG